MMQFMKCYNIKKFCSFAQHFLNQRVQAILNYRIEINQKVHSCQNLPHFYIKLNGVVQFAACFHHSNRSNAIFNKKDPLK